MDNSILANNAKSITLRIDAMRIANRITNPKIHYAKLNTKYHVKDEKGVHDSYFLISGDETNLNNWGVVGSSIPQNIQTGIGKPFVITSTDFIPNSYYKADYMHPNMIHFKKNLPQMVEGLDPDVYEDNLKFQEPYKVATIEKVFFNKPKDLWEVMILREPQFEDKEMPPFCSIAIFQNDKTEPEDKMTKWSVVHLAGLTESPAFGDQAIYNGKCNGSITSCSFRFADSKTQAETDLELAKGKMQIAKEEFKEDDHPRADDGKFAKGTGGGDTKPKKPKFNPTVKSMDQFKKQEDVIGDDQMEKVYDAFTFTKSSPGLDRDVLTSELNSATLKDSDAREALLKINSDRDESLKILKNKLMPGVYKDLESQLTYEDGINAGMRDALDSSKYVYRGVSKEEYASIKKTGLVAASKGVHADFKYASLLPAAGEEFKSDHMLRFDRKKLGDNVKQIKFSVFDGLDRSYRNDNSFTHTSVALQNDAPADTIDLVFTEGQK